MDRFKFIMAFLMTGGLTSSLVEAQSVSPANRPADEVTVGRSGDSPVRVRQNGEGTSSPDLQIEVIPQKNTDFSTKDDSLLHPPAVPGKIVDPTPAPQLQEFPDRTVNSAPWTEADQQELEKWRRLSHSPIHLVLVDGVLNIEWAGVKKSTLLQNHQAIDLQLTPR